MTLSDKKRPVRQSRENEEVMGSNETDKEAESHPTRSSKGFRLREDYQRRFDELVAREKYNGKNGPALIEEALEMLFDKYES